MATEARSKRKCRVLVLGAARPRIAKVVSLLLPLKKTTTTPLLEDVDIDYIPCVATFDSYEGEDGNQIRYLLSVNYHGPDGSQTVGSSLAPFFDDQHRPPQQQQQQQPSFTKRRRRPDNLGIVGVAIGAGIEDDGDIEKLRQFFQTLRGASAPGNLLDGDGDDTIGEQQRQQLPPLPMTSIQPNPDFATMKEETDAFRTFTNEEKDIAATEGTIGPGKMAKFAHAFATSLVQHILQKEQEEEERERTQQRELDKLEQQRQEEAARTKAASLPLDTTMDASKPRYACRKCRTVLFGDDDREDPPHAPAQHKFSARKMHHGGAAASASSACQSYFLAVQGLDWMGDMSDNEGRISCPKCTTKVGTWHWAGAQCSCGTWVAPALQIPKSKLDVIIPTRPMNSSNSMDTAGAVVVDTAEVS